MSVRAIRIAKEARLVLGAWVLVMVAGVLSLLPVPSTAVAWNVHALLEALVPFGAMFGIPLLATLAFGSEFQYRTIAMLMAQPVERREIWRMKMLVSMTAVGMAAVVYALALHALHAHHTEEWFSVVAVAVVATAAAPFYTFVARSMIGGLVLNVSGFLVITLVLDYLAYLVQASKRVGYQAYDEWHLRNLPVWFMIAAVVVYAAYAAVMAWLGRRRLLEFQAVEGMQAAETALPGARLFPRAVASWFRCRPIGPVLNLVRREFHLLRIVWVLGAVCAAMWAAIALFGLMPTPYSYQFILLVGVAVIGNVVIAVLAGAISLGEEKTWGTHGWHLTLPVSANTQWAIKLLVALFTTAVCAVLLPMGILKIGATIGGQAHGLAGGSETWMFLLYACLLTLSAFWSSCIVKGTVRATIWVLPVGLTVVGCVVFTSWMAQAGPHWLAHVMGKVVAAVGPLRVASIAETLWRLEFHKVLIAGMIAVVTGTALIQTRRAFASRREETATAPLLALVPVAVATLLCALAGEAVPALAIQAYYQQSEMLTEIHDAITAKQAKPPLPPNMAQQMSGDELALQPGLSSQTREWLKGSKVTVVNDTPEMHQVTRHALLAPSTLWAVVHGEARRSGEYVAIVRRANGTECALQYFDAPPAAKQFYSGRITGTCQ